nr:uncharacterized protein LOC126517516 isoform X3 [Dermacentor andersoni]
MRRFAFLKRSSRWEGTACGNTGRITVHVSAILTANIIAYQSELKILPKETRKTLYRKDVRVRTQTSSTVSREKKALNTNERTWIYQRSYVEYKGSEYVTCAYYRKLELNQTNYEFFKDFMLCSQAHQRHLYAELGDDGRDGPYMGVSTWPGAEVTSYTLRYWNATEACAVYTLDKYSLPVCLKEDRQSLDKDNHSRLAKHCNGSHCEPVRCNTVILFAHKIKTLEISEAFHIRKRVDMCVSPV